MLKRHANFFKSLLLLLDLATITIAWFGAYLLRFKVQLVPVTKGIPLLSDYFLLLIPIYVIWIFSFWSFDLYRPRRISSRLSEVWDMVKANTMSVLLLAAFAFFIRDTEFSRLVFTYFWALNITLLCLLRWTYREVLRVLRRRNYNLRYILVIGAENLAKEVINRFKYHPELGMTVVGCLTKQSEKIGQSMEDAEIIGTYDMLPTILAKRTIDQVFLALPADAQSEINKIMEVLSDYPVDIRIVPDVSQYMMLRSEAEMFDGLPILTLQASPLYGWSRVIKRSMDIGLSALTLIIASPLIIAISISIRWTSPGPIFYRQVRMGLDGKSFFMLKFRSMRVDAEQETGAVWTTTNDNRRTAIGKLLRQTSLDELPQCFNVLKGDMSLVGPRPERPELIEQCRTGIPTYVLRQKMKAGMTGWAQVHGWRGQTSLEKRVEHDLHYIEHWTPWLDLKILGMTLVKGFINKNAY
ncbi:MAG: undecaprenyl-phosphate glucose phosphotransferase [Nitrospiraceae bacterium]|nr:undecaprenyl-phosphate glucose phosphotransferase [Nitrospiraceae bacterium]|tara:strand:- start:259 stop:1662 length:1404 start_codon:yes stop_codon:yes gene_type:complete